MANSKDSGKRAQTQKDRSKGDTGRSVQSRKKTASKRTGGTPKEHLRDQVQVSPDEVDDPKYRKQEERLTNRVEDAREQLHEARETAQEVVVARGRKPRLLDKEDMDEFIDALTAGNTVRNACAMVGLEEWTFYSWMKKAESAMKGEDIKYGDVYIKFAKTVKACRAKAEHRNVMIIQTSAKKSWQASAWWLERTHPQDWGQKHTHRIGGDPEGVPIEHSSEVTVHSDEELTSVLKSLLKREEQLSEG